jgi:hypothetical protein
MNRYPAFSCSYVREMTIGSNSPSIWQALEYIDKCFHQNNTTVSAEPMHFHGPVWLNLFLFLCEPFMSVSFGLPLRRVCAQVLCSLSNAKTHNTPLWLREKEHGPVHQFKHANSGYPI